MSVRSVFLLPAIIVRHRELLWSFVRRDLKARYEGSLLGRLWPILNPLILFAVYYFVFVQVLKQKWESMGRTAIGSDAFAALYIVSGILPWTAFSESVLRCSGVVLENGNLVKKIAFPSQLLPVYAVVVNLVYFLIGLSLFLILRTIFFGPPGWNCLALLLVIPLQLVFTSGLGLFLGALTIFIRDTSQILGLVLQLWFFTTPIVYLSTLIHDTMPALASLMRSNPMFHLMEMYRACLVYDDGPFPWDSAAIFTAMAIGVFLPGYAFFLATKDRFADEL